MLMILTGIRIIHRDGVLTGAWALADMAEWVMAWVTAVTVVMAAGTIPGIPLADGADITATADMAATTAMVVTADTADIMVWDIVAAMVAAYGEAQLSIPANATLDGKTKPEQAARML